MARQAGVLLGDFHKSMETYDSTSFYEVIPNFHNLSYRTKQFHDALERADKSSINEVQDQINMVQLLSADAEHLDTLKSTGKIPLRVTHNDAKLSNMLFDKTAIKAVAMIDFDTVMSGIIHYDIGDAIRSICSVASEDEVEVSKIDFNIDYYRAFMEGFLPIISSSLSEIEKQTLPLSIKYMLYEQSLRFLTDHINGNIYYKVDYPEHNLVRTKNQLKLLQIVGDKFNTIETITKTILKGLE